MLRMIVDRAASEIAPAEDRTLLRFGRDDFADVDRLARTLSRERGKDMASDYGERPDPERSFAERRGITFPERFAEIVREVVSERVLDLFGGLHEDRAERQADRSVQAPGREIQGSLRRCRNALLQSKRLALRARNYWSQVRALDANDIDHERHGKDRSAAANKTKGKANQNAATGAQDILDFAE
jgi:hypothetical protein